MALLKSKERHEVVALLLTISSALDQQWRRLLLSDLPDRLRYTIPESDVPRIHLDSIIAACNKEDLDRSTDGECPLVLVLEQAYSYSESAQQSDQLRQWIDEVRHRAEAVRHGMPGPDRPTQQSLPACQETTDRVHRLLIRMSWRQLKPIFKIIARDLQETISTLEDLRRQPDQDRRVIDDIRADLNAALVALYQAWELSRSHDDKLRSQSYEYVQACRDRLLAALEHFPRD